MTNEEKLVEEVARAMWVSEGKGDGYGNYSPWNHSSNKLKPIFMAQARAVIPIIKADLLREMMEPSEEMIEVGSVGYEPNPKEQWPGMLRAFAKAKGIEIE